MVVRLDGKEPGDGDDAPVDRLAAYRRISLTAACSELPIGPIMDALSRPAPAREISGCLTMKGPIDNA